MLYLEVENKLTRAFVPYDQHIRVTWKFLVEIKLVQSVLLELQCKVSFQLVIIWRRC